MSFRRVGRGAFRLAQDLIFRFRGINVQKAAASLLRITPQAANLASTAVRPRSANIFFRGLRSIFRGANARVLLRPFSVIDHNRIRLNANRISRRFRVYPWRFSTADTGALIRNLFITNMRCNPHLASPELPARLDEYEIGSNIACGCHAAVYELRIGNVEHPKTFGAVRDVATASSPTSDAASASVRERLSAFPLALKIMFNYQFDAPEHRLWSEMGSELVPLIQGKSLLLGRMKNVHSLKRPHPNIIKMYTAFTDHMPSLPDAETLYPEALPTASFYELILHEPKTLFIVMKRYRMTLREYVLTMKRNYWTARVMYGQLLEAIVCLHEQKISHRDMKSDNILLDFDSDDDVPHLVLGDFGCALATGSWIVDYSNDSVDLGGNLALRAPEVRCARPGPGVSIDFRMADLWAAATLGYEMFTRCNPFYSKMKSYDYRESALPDLPKRLHYAVKAITRDMLQRDPLQRPDPHVAANVVCISLFRFGEDVKNFLNNCGLEEIVIGRKISELGNAVSGVINRLAEKAQKTLDDVMMLYASETIFSRRLCPSVVSSAELQLRATFLSRLDREKIWSALSYFYALSEDMANSTSSWSSVDAALGAHANSFQQISVN